MTNFLSSGCCGGCVSFKDLFVGALDTDRWETTGTVDTVGSTLNLKSSNARVITKLPPKRKQQFIVDNSSHLLYQGLAEYYILWLDSNNHIKVTGQPYYDVFSAFIETELTFTKVEGGVSSTLDTFILSNVNTINKNTTILRVDHDRLVFWDGDSTEDLNRGFWRIIPGTYEWCGLSAGIEAGSLWTTTVSIDGVMFGCKKCAEDFEPYLLSDTKCFRPGKDYYSIIYEANRANWNHWDTSGDVSGWTNRLTTNGEVNYTEEPYLDNNGKIFAQATTNDGGDRYIRYRFNQVDSNNYHCLEYDGFNTSVDMELFKVTGGSDSSIWSTTSDVSGNNVTISYDEDGDITVDWSHPTLGAQTSGTQSTTWHSDGHKQGFSTHGTTGQVTVNSIHYEVGDSNPNHPAKYL